MRITAENLNLKPKVLDHQPIVFETAVSGKCWDPGDGKPPWAGGGDTGDCWKPGDGKPPWAGGGKGKK